MARMSQKDLLNEGIGSMLKKAAQAVGGAVGAVGGALKTASDAGINATWGGTAKGGAEGAKKGWKGVKDALTGRGKELEDYIEDLGYMVKQGTDIRGKRNLKVVHVVDLDYTDEGKKKAGQSYPRPATFKYEDGSWKQVKSPRGRVLTQRQPENEPSDKEKAEIKKLEQDAATDIDDTEDGVIPETPAAAEPAAAEPQLSQKEVISTSKDVGTVGEFGLTPKAPPEAAAPTFKPGDTASFTNKKGEVKDVKVIKDLGTGKSEVKFSNGSQGAVDNNQLQATETPAEPAVDPGKATKPPRKRKPLTRAQKDRKNELERNRRAAKKKVPKENFSQKNLLQQLHMLHS